MKRASAFDLWSLGFQTGVMMLEAQSVVAMRMLGMAGLWQMNPTEPLTMLAEKPAAFANSASAATVAAMKGQSPDKIAAAAIKPLRHKTRSNSRRLAKRHKR